MQSSTENPKLSEIDKKRKAILLSKYAIYLLNPDYAIGLRNES
jgi:hypothetical protein